MSFVTSVVIGVILTNFVSSLVIRPLKAYCRSEGETADEKGQDDRSEEKAKTDESTSDEYRSTETKDQTSCPYVVNGVWRLG